MEKKKISFFSRGVQDTDPRETSVEQLVHLIAHDEMVKELTLKYRYFKKQGFNNDATTTKNRMPGFAVPVLFEGGKAEKNITGCTYLSLVDIDKITSDDEMQRIWNLVRANPHTLVAYPTISGKGMRALFCYTDPEGFCMDELMRTDRKRAVEIYKDFYRQGNEYYCGVLGIREYDRQCKNATRISLLAHCPEVYYNPEAEPLTVTLPDKDTDGKDTKKQYRRNVSLDKVRQKALDKVKSEGLEYRDGQRNKYVSRLCYLLNAYGAKKKEVREWAVEMFSDYQDEEGNGVDRVVDSCYSHTNEHGTAPLKKNTQASVHEIEAFLGKEAGFRFNVITRKCEVKLKGKEHFTELTDRLGNTLWSRMNKQGKAVRVSDIYNVLHSEFVPEYNPFHHYFSTLPAWDGQTDAIAALAARVHVAGGKQEFFTHCFRKWLVAMVGSLLSDEVVNQSILVLIGKQGVYKTTWLRRLLPTELQPYFYTKTNSNRFTKDDQFTLTEFALMCFEEIDSMSYAEINQLKALTTIDNINERAAYGRNKEHRPHIASFCATGNNLIYLTDDTGNRRFLTFEVERIDNPYHHPVDYTAVYSQAYALWKQGFEYWFESDEIQTLNEHNEAFRVPNMEEELILTHFHVPDPSKNETGIFMTNTDILIRINAGLKVSLSAKKVGMLMKKLGFEPTKNTVDKRGYWVVVHSFEQIERWRRRP